MIPNMYFRLSTIPTQKKLISNVLQNVQMVQHIYVMSMMLSLIMHIMFPPFVHHYKESDKCWFKWVFNPRDISVAIKFPQSQSVLSSASLYQNYSPQTNWMSGQISLRRINNNLSLTLAWPSHHLTQLLAMIIKFLMCLNTWTKSITI